MSDTTIRRCADCGEPHGRRTKTLCSPCARARIPEAPCRQCAKPCRPFVGGRCAACYHRGRVPGTAPTRECRQCYREYRAVKPGRDYCSRVCANRAKVGTPPTRGEVVPSLTPWIPEAPVATIPGGWFCQGACMICGHAFTSRARSATCSDACKREARARTMRAVNQRRRARKLGARHEKINSTDIFTEAHWTCAQCRNVVTTWQGRWTPTLATLDHIVPLAHGGSHTHDNVQCLCAQCNSIKSDTLPADA